jgi:alanyl-tRNA synthetase
LRVEEVANRLVREDHPRRITENISLAKARSMGAMALFGEKYGETVRVVQFGDSIELCGGTHVNSTAGIGLIKIVSESAIAAGIRRIEAVTANKADEYINEKIASVEEVAALLKSTGNIRESVEKIIAENASLRKTIERLQDQITSVTIKDLKARSVKIGEIRFVSGIIESDSADALKNIASGFRKITGDTIVVIGAAIFGKANIAVMVSDRLVNEKNINAAEIIKEISKDIDGGGGGQPFLATAGGKNPEGIINALKKAEEFVRKI